jgi:hypothetical protein
VLVQHGRQRADRRRVLRLAGAGEIARAVHRHRAEEGVEADLLDVLVSQPSTACQTASVLVNNISDLGRHQRLLNGGQELVRLGQMESERVRPELIAA